MERFGKKNKKRKNKKPQLEQSKQDKEIAKYLRFNVPSKSTMVQKEAVDYFVGSKAVDILLQSKWADREKGSEQLFVGRDDAVEFLDELLQKRFFYRVMKTEHESKKKDKKNEEKDQEKTTDEQDGDNISSNKLKKRKTKKNADSEEDKEKGDEKKDKKKTKDEKKKEKVKKKYKLTYHDEQLFLDSKDLYIWVYNPVSWKTIIKGVAMMIFVAMASLFPLWPDNVRVGVYYLSVTAGVVIGSVFVVALLRTLLFGVIWLFTFGKHHLWILPNLLEDVGFFESFKPWYSYEYKGPKEEENEEDEDSEDGQESAAEEENEDKGHDSQNEKVSEHSADEEVDAVPSD